MRSEGFIGITLLLRRNPFSPRFIVMQKNQIAHIKPQAQSGRVHAIVETARGSRCKYNYEEKSGLFTLSKMLPHGLCFPYDFGFIPSTLGQDGDALDIMLIFEEATFTGCLVTARLIGVLEAKQGRARKKMVRNDRLIGVIETERNPSNLKTIQDLGKQRLGAIENFFVTYNALEGKTFYPLGFHGPKQAKKLLAHGAKQYLFRKS